MNKCKLKFNSKFSSYSERMEIEIRITFPKKEVDSKLIENIDTYLPIFKGNNIILKHHKRRKVDHGCWKHEDSYTLALTISNKSTYDEDGKKMPSLKMRMDSKYSNKEYEYFFKKNGDLVIKNVGGMSFREIY